jgi:photosystem II stability/assembly factor-like uncharacterized protein
MAKRATKRRRPPAKGRQIQDPQRRKSRRRGVGWLGWAAVAVAAALAGLWLAKRQAEEQSAVVAPPAAGLPQTPDYHSLLVSPADPRRLLLGTHAGLYASTNGGRSWTTAGLQRQDAMNLVRPSSSVLWAAGHEVLAKSVDSGRTWSDVRPNGLPGLDVHGFAADPGNPIRLYAAIAGEGLYRSADGGQRFELVSRQVGPSVFALAVTPDGRILAGDTRQGLMVSGDGGTTWRLALRQAIAGLAINPKDPKRILATGPGILLSTDGGESWRRVLALEQGAGPVAWSASKPNIAYVVGLDRRLYRTNDGGASWKIVS